MSLERVKTGIESLDALIEGGIPKGRIILVAGGCGTGKSILSTQFLYMGAKYYNEPGIMITTEERPKSIRQNMLRFGWDLKQLEDDKKIAIIDAASPKARIPSSEMYKISYYDTNSLLLKIYEAVNEIGAKRAVIDSIPGLALRLESESEIRRAISQLGSLLAELDCTSLVVSEVNVPGRLGRYGIEEFIADGVYLLENVQVDGKFERTFSIVKMRGTNNSKDMHGLRITNKGIEIMARKD
ncbi:MAG: ATPase domain-containing protein [Promethearchaeati archaeon SRVP18_Atabeyarchaeia-1]